MTRRVRVLDLFSGIGGFSLGLERAGMTTVAFCEIEPFCRAVLAKHWPGVPIYDDVRTLTGARLAADGVVPDLICGGFPCQPHSRTGAKKGAADDRNLWPEFARLIHEIRPSWVIAENVDRLLGSDAGRFFAGILGDLAEIGYDAQWDCIPASAVGAHHRRDRVWLVAYPHGGGWREQGHVTSAFGDAKDRQSFDPREARLGWPAEPDMGRVVHGLSDKVDRRKRLIALGNAVVPQIPELIGRAIMRAEARHAA